MQFYHYFTMLITKSLQQSITEMMSYVLSHLYKLTIIAPHMHMNEWFSDIYRNNSNALTSAFFLVIPRVCLEVSAQAHFFFVILDKSTYCSNWKQLFSFVLQADEIQCIFDLSVFIDFINQRHCRVIIKNYNN